ncbi:hypothetical protein PINS_up004120 [Pythium insidiosum]|nr:hypothetical protein PINS_up004120 [Pythium insidiosum]
MPKPGNTALSALIQQAPMYTIERPEELVKFVDDKETMHYFSERARLATIVGIDTETRPQFRDKHRSHRCSLLQIALRLRDTKEEVFILDLLKLKPHMYNKTLLGLFLSQSVIKLGQSLLGDLKELASSYPGASCFRVAKAVVEVNDMSISLMGAHQALSLQKLVFLYLGKRLTKTQQMSNWNRRPLTTSQIHYAACDALVLIHLYDVLLERLKANKPHFNVDSISNVLDVHIDLPPKCQLCFEYFDNKRGLKEHRRECNKGVRSLSVCSSCGEMLFVEANLLAEHKKQCGDGDEAPSDETSTESSTPPVSRKRPCSASTADDAPTCEAQGNATAVSNKDKRRKRKRIAINEKEAASATTAAARTRKMSEGTLFAADDIWKEISDEQVDNLSS